MSQENKTAIKFDEVSFQYGRGHDERPILNKLTFRFQKESSSASLELVVQESPPFSD